MNLPQLTAHPRQGFPGHLGLSVLWEVRNGTGRAIGFYGWLQTTGRTFPCPLPCFPLHFWSLISTNSSNSASTSLCSSLTVIPFFFGQEFGALMRNYVPPPSLPTYSVLLEGESMSPSMGLLRDDLLNVCMRHVEKICKADLGRNFIERNHMENGKIPQMCPSRPSLPPWRAGQG